MSEYEVGYGKPPKKGQFKPGQSGNPKGRPKGSKSFARVLADELSERIPVKEGGKTRRLTKMQAVAKQLVNQAMNGDPRARAEVLRQIRLHLPDEGEVGADDLFTTDADRALIEDFLRRSTPKASGGGDGE